ncbi:LacI family DNA-binding transcriptional regulator [Devriesea agamarum]|uniref:LacI family DNA-binding transcriptional regulator n=1 Tax=Devriesea agamarum TaxID=472569 RepID=UPI00071E1EFB|nr:LacI family DNA-binding transcriptional regulator [Devriesea agamarum]
MSQPVPPRRPWQPPHLRDVAQRAGVSIPTASRALSTNHHSPREDASSSPTHRAVQEAARELGYLKGRRNEPARPHVAILTSDISRSGYWMTLAGALDTARDLDANLTIHLVPGAVASRADTIAQLLTEKLDGVVVMEFDTPCNTLIHELPVDLPLAIAGGQPDGETEQYPRAWTDDRRGAQQATDYLLDLGHHHVDYIGVPPANYPDPRAQGWRDALAARGLNRPEPLGVGWSVTTGRRLARIVAERRTTAVLCGNDDLAAGVVAELTALGISVPGKVSIIGFDDHPYASAMTPALSTVRLRFSQIGAAATRLALGLDTESVEIPADLILRGSTAPPNS